MHYRSELKTVAQKIPGCLRKIGFWGASVGHQEEETRLPAVRFGEGTA